MKDYCNYSLLGHNTFGIEANCHRFLEFTSVPELKEILALLTDEDMPLLLLGGGSNLLLTGDYQGTVLHSAIKGMEAKEEGNDIVLRCGSGEVWDDVVAFCVEKGWHGAENLSFIPGEVGASAVQNIGAYGVEVKDLIVSVEAVEIETGNTVTFPRSRCGYAYRQSNFKGEWRDEYVITHVTYRFSKTFHAHLDYGNVKACLAERGITMPTAQQMRNVIIDIRKAKLPDPAVEGNAGSFFMNPVVEKGTYDELLERYPLMPHYPIDEEHVKIPAAWMIDQCGWKGKTLGRAGVHNKQPLVLVNRGGATGEEVVTLFHKIQMDVYHNFGIVIHPEVNIK